MRYYYTAASKAITEQEAKEQGFSQDPECTEGFLTRKNGDYVELITRIKVHCVAVDGAWTKTFKSVAGAKAFVAREWKEEGQVSTDGISRFDGYSVRLVYKTWFPISL